jgi:hypothetical protein
LPSPADGPHPDESFEIELIVAHMAASIGQQKALAVVSKALIDLGLPEKGRIDGVSVEKLLTKVSGEPGLVGLAAKVTRQMLKMKIAPLKPAF